MNVGYSDPVPWVARERAQIIAESYVTYRTPKPAASPRHPAPATATTPATVTTLHATLITPADLPASPSSPNYLVDILAALIVGLGLAIGTAAIRDHLDDRLRGPADLESRSGAPVLSLVPAYQPLSRDPASHLTIVWNANSVVAEAYRGLRTRVIAAGAARGARTLLVTSAGWERKSMIAANLAVALAQSGRRTVLVCADLRWGSAHRLLGVPNETGLSTLLDRRGRPGLGAARAGHRWPAGAAAGRCRPTRRSSCSGPPCAPCSANCAAGPISWSSTRRRCWPPPTPRRWLGSRR